MPGMAAARTGPDGCDDSLGDHPVGDLAQGIGGQLGGQRLDLLGIGTNGDGRQRDHPLADAGADRDRRMRGQLGGGLLGSEFDDLADDSQAGNAEIPAFLRRQAN